MVEIREFTALTLGSWLAASLPTPAHAAGEQIDGYPNWEERVYLALANRARVAPELEMAECGDNCPDAACYTVRPPLRHDPVLARASRFHAQEMGVRNFFSHTSSCTLVDDIADRWPTTCDGAAECACVGGVDECSGSCTSAQSRVNLFGAGYMGEISVGVSDPHWGFYLWLHEPSTSEQCVFGNGNGHRWLLMTSQGRVGFGAHDNHGNGDFGSGGGPSDEHPIPSGSHYPRAGQSVDVWANWYGDAPPSLATVNVDGTCLPMELERGTESNGSYARALDGLSAAGCYRYYFVFKDEAGETITYPTAGSLGIGPAASCSSWSAERPAQGEGCDCTPWCEGQGCGDDGCGGSCGSCDDGFTCAEGQCEALPDPGDDSGGDDGTSGSGGDSGDSGAGDGDLLDSDGGDAIDSDGDHPEPAGGDDPSGPLPPYYGDSRGSGGGCTVAAPGREDAGWLLLLTFPLIGRLRRARPRSESRCC